MNLRFSVVIPTYRRDELLERCLTALALQTFESPAAGGSRSGGNAGRGNDSNPEGASPYEIVVCDDANSPRTRWLVAEFARSVSTIPVRYVAVAGNHGPAAARNAGWRTAQGEIVAFTDDDCVPDRHWLDAAAKAFDRDPAVKAAWGKLQMPLPDRPTDYQRDAAGLASAEFVTANCFCRRETLQDVGGFDERFQLAWREDSDLYFSLRERGHRVVHCPEAVVVHPIRPAGWGVSLRQQRKSLYDALLFKKHPALYRKSIPPFPRDYYFIVGLGILAAFAGAMGEWIVSGIVMVAGLALVARFCRRRLQGTSRAPAHVAEMIVTSALIPPVSLYWRLRGSICYRILFFY